MALKQRENGEYEISSVKEVKEAMALRDDMIRDIEEAGLLEIQQDASELSRAIGRYMTENGVNEIKDAKTNRRAVLVQRFNRKWITTRKELKDSEVDEAKALQDLVDKDVYMKITKRVVDPAALDEAVRDGLVTEKEIAAAYIEIPQKPFAQIYDLREPDEE
jgi:hypothetical protein